MGTQQLRKAGLHWQHFLDNLAPYTTQTHHASTPNRSRMQNPQHPWPQGASDARHITR